jgi:serine protease inhibitor
LLCLLFLCLPVVLQTLQSPTIGITAAFDAKVADFSKISDTPLFVTKVMQSVSA